jgi:hypothetical protein
VVISLWFICSSLLSLVISLLMLSLPIWCDVSCQVPLISLWGLWWMSLWSLWGLFLWVYGYEVSLSLLCSLSNSHTLLCLLCLIDPHLYSVLQVDLVISCELIRCWLFDLQA